MFARSHLYSTTSQSMLEALTAIKALTGVLMNNLLWNNFFFSQTLRQIIPFSLLPHSDHTSHSQHYHTSNIPCTVDQLIHIHELPFNHMFPYPGVILHNFF